MRKSKRFLAMGVAFAMSIATVTGLAVPTAQAAPVGSGFTVTPRIWRSSSSRSRSPSTTRQRRRRPTRADTGRAGPGPDPGPTHLLRPAHGRRLVQQPVPGRRELRGRRPAVPALDHAGVPGRRDITRAFPVGPPGPTSYSAEEGQRRSTRSPASISNLIVDQTSTNPAAIAAAEFPVRTQGNPGHFPCTTDPDPQPIRRSTAVPAGCVPSHQTLVHPERDNGRRPVAAVQLAVHLLRPVLRPRRRPDREERRHGLRAAERRRSAGHRRPRRQAGTGDEVPPSQAFMVLTRAQNQPGPDGVLGNGDDVQNANNTDSPWVDQSQTYTSHSVAPGVPARIRDELRRPPGRRPASCWAGSLPV